VRVMVPLQTASRVCESGKTANSDSSLYKETYRYVLKDCQSFSPVDEGRKDHKNFANKEHFHFLSVSWNVTTW
jgi:hypothetical protein